METHEGRGSLSKYEQKIFRILQKAIEKVFDSKNQTTDKRTQNGHISKRSQWIHQKRLCGLCLSLSQTSLDGARNHTS